MITSTSNALIKSIRKLRDKKYRALSGLAWIEGTKLVMDAIDQGADIVKLLLAESFTRSEKRLAVNSKIADLSLEKIIVTDDVFRNISTKENPQGIAAVIQQKWLPFETFKKQFFGIWVGLWEIADPGNLGSIMRTVDAVNARGVILLENCTDPYDPSAIRGSMGAVFSNNLVKSNSQEFVDWTKSSEIAVYGTSDAAKMYYRDANYQNDLILVMGSERQGLPDTILNICKEIVRIPMNGISDSLNLAVATGIVLYEILDQHLK